MTGRCKDCRWWLERVRDRPSEKFIPAENHLCSLINLHERCKSIAVVTGGHNVGFAELYTGPDFGCVHFEPLIPDADRP